jgi:hypothetical protein
MQAQQVEAKASGHCIELAGPQDPHWHRAPVRYEVEKRKLGVRDRGRLD